MSEITNGNQLICCGFCGEEYRHCERVKDYDADIFLCPKCGEEYDPQTYECVSCGRKFGEHEERQDNKCVRCWSER